MLFLELNQGTAARVLEGRLNPERGRLEISGYAYGPKGQGNLAQGLPWVSQKNVFSPEGAPGRECHNCGRKTVLAYRPAPSGPIRWKLNPG
jgi:hypothetical protein